jgi:hypothetical protein
MYFFVDQKAEHADEHCDHHQADFGFACHNEVPSSKGHDQNLSENIADKPVGVRLSISMTVCEGVWYRSRLPEARNASATTSL